jgi:hypothetical protein
MYKNKNEMTMIVKRFGTHISLGNLGLSLGKVHCSQGKLAFPQKNNHVFREKEINLLWGTTKTFFSLGNNYVKPNAAFNSLCMKLCLEIK